MILTSPSLLVEGVRSGSRRRNAATVSSLARGILSPFCGVQRHGSGDGTVPSICGVCLGIVLEVALTLTTLKACGTVSG